MTRFSLLTILACSLLPTAALAITWGDVLDPATGAPRVIGSHTAGCVQGAVPLAPEGPGFQVMRRSRQRFFGHPVLVRYLQALGNAVARQRLGVLLIGDLGQSRGGPMPSGHRSHQNGLDADIWFWLRPEGSMLTLAERETIAAPSMLTPDGLGLDTQQWSRRQVEVLQVATGFDVVARIFVNPVIKKALCRQVPGASWLQKLRPWWGHDDHFHVRLYCPAGETACKDQELPPTGDGCGADLAWWFSEEARKPRPPIDIPKVPLPAACEEILRK